MTSEALVDQFRKLIPEAGLPILGLGANPDYKALLALAQSFDFSSHEQCGLVVSALGFASQDFDLPTQLAVRSVAESIDWPTYTLSDGYWIEAADNSVFLTEIGMGFTEKDAALMSDVVEERAPGFGYIALGMATNEAVPLQIIKSLVNFEDPVLALASTHPALEPLDIATLLNEIADGAWVCELVLGREGWPELDWKDAFTIASERCRKSPAFWEVLLSGMAGETTWRWLDEFLEEFEDGCESGELDDLADAMRTNPGLIEIARLSGWTEAEEVAEEVSAN